MVSGCRERDERFHGEICGFGTSSGTRIVVGRWLRSPFGSFADAMVEGPDGRRVLLGPSEEVCEYIAGVYSFDEVRATTVAVERRATSLRIDAGPFTAQLTIGPRTPAGWALRAVPRSVATSPTWATLLDPLARRLRPGVRTRGSTPGGREFYGATDERSVVAVRATWDGHDLGTLQDVHPPVRFGFGSSPVRPAIVSVVTTVRRHPRRDREPQPPVS